LTHRYTVAIQIQVARRLVERLLGRSLVSSRRAERK
jgi:hypothetical protein